MSNDNQESVGVGNSIPSDTHKAMDVSLQENTVVVDDTPMEPVVEEVLVQEQTVVIQEDEDQIESKRMESEAEVIKNTPSNRKPHKAVQEYDLNAVEKLTSGDELVLPASYDKETRQTLEKVPNVALLDSPTARQWANDVAEGLSYSTSQEMFVPTLEDEGSEFRQKMEHNGQNLSAQSPKFKAIENQTLKGERAVIRLISHLGLGTLFQVPLWHSGLWVTFKPPSESEIIELNRALIADKVKFGRYTYGLAYSNTTAYTVDRLVDFALSHVYDMTAKAEDVSIESLRQHISCQDIPSLLWGFICTMYPRGFRYRRACIADPEKCNHILEETLNVTKLQWTNNSALSEWQKTFMSGRQPKNKDLASITRYKEELAQVQKKRVLINEGRSNEIAITIKTPSISEYIEAGHRWIGDIVSTVDRALGADASDNERNSVIIRHGQASAMRQYSHWIESIEYDTNTINDKETIEQTLDVLSADDQVRTDMIQAVVDYINKSTISVIGIPLYDCSNCGTTQTSSISLSQYKNIIPLDVIQIFFGLLTQRLERMADR